MAKEKKIWVPASIHTYKGKRRELNSRKARPSGSPQNKQA
jgi:hypothetical protein